MTLAVRQLLRCCLGLVLAVSLSACSLLQGRDPVTVSVIGIEPLPGQELEIRMAIKLRVQNPNEAPIAYNGVALDLEVNGQPLAAGVSDQRGTIGRYDEGIVSIPVSITAFSMLRQAVGLSQLRDLDGMPYVLRGKLAGGAFGTMRFTDRGRLRLPQPTDAAW